MMHQAGRTSVLPAFFGHFYQELKAGDLSLMMKQGF